MENTTVQSNNCNDLLAKIIDEKLKAAGLVSMTDNELIDKLSKGQLKDVEWKKAFLSVINNIPEKLDSDEIK